MKSIAFSLIFELLVKLVNKLDCRFCLAGFVNTKPNQDVICILVDLVHELYFLTSLLQVFLVDAILVGLNPMRPIPKSQLSQRTEKASSNLKVPFSFVCGD